MCGYKGNIEALRCFILGICKSNVVCATKFMNKVEGGEVMGAKNHVLVRVHCQMVKFYHLIALMQVEKAVANLLPTNSKVVVINVLEQCPMLAIDR